MATAWDQTHVRYRNDDGDEAAATWRAAANAGCSIDVSNDVILRIRFGVKQTGTTAAGLVGYLRYSRNGGAWTTVNPSSNYARSAVSAYVAGGDPLTQQLTTGTYVVGEFDADGFGVSEATVAQNKVTELEYCVTLRSAELADGDTIAFELYRTGSAAFQAYSSGTITISLTKAPPPAGGRRRRLILFASAA